MACEQKMEPGRVQGLRLGVVGAGVVGRRQDPKLLLCLLPPLLLSSCSAMPHTDTRCAAPRCGRCSRTLAAGWVSAPPLALSMWTVQSTEGSLVGCAVH
eukprot:409488-Rhodomonas_salina.2